MSLTTNGIGLARQAQALKDAGLDRVNVSLDTIRPDTFQQLARRDRLKDVLAGLEAAQAAGLTPVKVNAVLMRGVNDQQAPELLQFCLDHGYELRFIEQMPLDAQHGWNRATMITADEILEQLGERVRPGADRRGDPRQRAGGVLHRPAAGRRPSASSRPSPGRSAVTATGSG